MEDFEEGVRALHQRVGELDALLQQRSLVADLADRRADAAHDEAETAHREAARNSRRIRRLFTAGVAVALLWTPLTAYGAVWTHELVRNNCYPGVIYDEPARPGGEPWFCHIFPGTDRPHSPHD